MTKIKIQLPSVLTEDTPFYEKHQEQLKPHLGKYYISYSTVSSWFSYKEDLIKQKFAGIKLDSGIYADLGSYVGEAVETGQFPSENPHNFQGQENVDLDKLRPNGAEYEKLIVIDRGDYIIVGFIDIYLEENGVCHILDLKSGGAKKENEYSSKDYIQVILYAHAIESLGKKIGSTKVYFIRRTGSHINPPLVLSKEQFEIPLEYNKERVKFALAKVDKAVKEISELYTTYTKIFG